MNKEEKTGGIDFCVLLTLIFITLKLMDVLLLSWLWVLAPLWVPFALALGFHLARVLI